MNESIDRVNEVPETWGEENSKTFIEFGRAMVPGWEEIERAFLDLITAEPDESFLGVEVGIGAGWLSSAVLREFPEARMLGLDGSRDMLQQAAKALDGYGERVELRRSRLEDPSWTNGLPEARVFLSSLVFHHSGAAGKRDLFALLFDRLEPGESALPIVDLRSNYSFRGVGTLRTEVFERCRPLHRNQ